MIGVMLRQPNPVAQRAVLRMGWQVVDDPFACEKTLLWMPHAQINLEAFAPIITWLDKWEVAVPFRPYDILAQNLDSEEARAGSLPLLLDLRQPVYDSRVVMIRNCPRTRRLIQAWAQVDMQAVEDTNLAFLRAVWRVKPLLLALPNTWAEGGPKPSPKP